MILKPLKMTRAPPRFESEPESSPTGPCAVSGDKAPGAGLGGLPFDGSVTGASPGVAELDGMLAEASGVVELAGTGAVSGALTGAMAGDEPGTGDETGEDPFVDGLGVGETDVAGGLAGDFAGERDGDFAGGETDGDFAGGVDTGGETVGADVGGEVVGDFEVGVGVVAGEMVGEEVGEVAGEGDFVGVGFGEGEGAGALSACTTPECETHRTNIESTTSLCIFGTRSGKKSNNLICVF
jgi:hypothetical protein